MGLGDFVRRKLGAERTLHEIGQLAELMTATARDAADAARNSREATVILRSQTAILTKCVREVIRRSSPSAFFRVLLNQADLLLPRDTIQTMLHCLTAGEDGTLRIDIEAGHQDWMRKRMAGGGVFLDVGSATGAMTLPIVATNDGVRSIAFEPSRTARGLLSNTLKENGIADRVEVIDAAVSDHPGTLEFSELQFDASTGHNFLPETSRLSGPNMSYSELAVRYSVPVISLDAFFADRPDATKVKVVKIDVEGFEVHVLRGAESFLRQFKPHLAIDIHHDPFGERDAFGQIPRTEPACRDLLTRHGYRFDNLDHVLLCTPPNTLN